jgi:hypothetical protein
MPARDQAKIDPIGQSIFQNDGPGARVSGKAETN